MALLHPLSKITQKIAAVGALAVKSLSTSSSTNLSEHSSTTASHLPNSEKKEKKLSEEEERVLAIKKLDVL